MNKKLIIVESPGKIKKIKSIVGSEYNVISSNGHILNLHPKKMSIDFKNFFPEYHPIKEKEKIIKNIINQFKKSSQVIIASDNDREGEMIGWSYKYILNLNENNYDRIIFNSITKTEINNAIKNPKKINMLIVESQRSRRILDRIIGFKISSKLNNVFNSYQLSAGRVQSVVLKLICDKENKIINFNNNESSFSIYSILKILNFFQKYYLYYTKQENMKKLNKSFFNYNEIKKILKKILKSVLTIVTINKEEKKIKPKKPYITSSILYNINNELNIPLKIIMKSLVKLYESGYITYIRTDSSHLSNEILNQCEKYINKNYGNEYHQRNKYINKENKKLIAHEAIRPVNIELDINKIKKLNNYDIKIYNLILNRTLTSQMKSVIVNVYNIVISISKMSNFFFQCYHNVTIFIGFMIIYNKKKNISFKDIKKLNSKIEILELGSIEKYKNPPKRYSESTLIKKLDFKNLNIGRPSTYISIINIIQKRNYICVTDFPGIKKNIKKIIWSNNKFLIKNEEIIISNEKNKFYPTDLGNEVNNFMIKNFSEIIDYNFTSNIEKQLDSISYGNMTRYDFLNNFWNNLQPLLNRNLYLKKEIIICKHPKTGYDIKATIGYYGPYLIIPMSNKKKDNINIPIIKPLSIDNIKKNDILKLIQYPKFLGLYENNKIELRIGRNGFYISFGNNKKNIEFIKIPIDLNSKNINLNEAIILIEKKRSKYLFYYKENDNEYIINKKFGKRYLIIITKDKKTRFLKFPSNITNLTLDNIKEFINNFYL